MNFTFETQGNNTYLVYEIGPKDSIDSMSLGMLTNNKIPGLATTLFTQMDTTKYIMFNVSSKISVRQFFNGPVNRKRLIGVFNGIVSAVISSDEYMIDPSSIMLDLDYIFTDVSSCETILLCVPLEGYRCETKLSDFFKNIMFNTRFDQTENCDYIAKIMNYLNSSPLFSPEEFKGLLDSIEAPVAPKLEKTEEPAPVDKGSFEQPKVSVGTMPSAVPTPISTNTGASNQPKVNSGTELPSYGNTTGSGTELPTYGNMSGTAVPPSAGNASKSGKKEKKSGLFSGLFQKDPNKGQNKASKKSASQATAQYAVPGMAISGAENQGMAIPGAENQGMAIPGQPTPAPKPTLDKKKSLKKSDTKSANNSVSPVMPASAPVGSGFPASAPVGSGFPASAPVGSGFTAMSGGNTMGATPSAMPVGSPVSTAQPVVPVASTMGTTPPVTPLGNSANFGETTVLNKGNAGETTVLNAVSLKKQKQIIPHLIRMKNNEKISVNKPIFKIGTEHSYVDYYVSDNSAVSRSHANIVSRDGEYFLVDTNSTNHSYVNGEMIKSNVEVKIEHGTKVMLANEDFEFKLY